MIFLVLWLLVVFTGFSIQLAFLGNSIKDYDWFKRLQFHEDTQDVAFTHAIVDGVFTCILGIDLLIGVVAYLSTPSNSAIPTTIGRVVSTSLFILTAAALPSLSIYLRLRRRAILQREEKQQLKLPDELPTEVHNT
jgi:hypothetical protein